MKISYYPETGSIYIELRPGPDVETREVASGLNEGTVVGFDIDGAHGRYDLSVLETVALPASRSKAA